MEVFIREARNWEAVTDKFLVYQSRRINTVNFNDSKWS